MARVSVSLLLISVVGCSVDSSQEEQKLNPKTIEEKVVSSDSKEKIVSSSSGDLPPLYTIYGWDKEEIITWGYRKTQNDKWSGLLWPAGGAIIGGGKGDLDLYLRVKHDKNEQEFSKQGLKVDVNVALYPTGKKGAIRTRVIHSTMKHIFSNLYGCELNGVLNSRAGPGHPNGKVIPYGEYDVEVKVNIMQGPSLSFQKFHILFAQKDK